MSTTCYQCRGDVLPGVLTGANGPYTVEVCDQCAAFESDLDAALAVAQKIGGIVKFIQHDADLWDDVERRIDSGDLDNDYDPVEVGFELRTYIGPDESACLRYSEYPWIDIDGYEVNWIHYRRMRAALGSQCDCCVNNECECLQNLAGNRTVSEEAYRAKLAQNMADAAKDKSVPNVTEVE